MNWQETIIEVKELEDASASPDYIASLINQGIRNAIMRQAQSTWEARQPEVDEAEQRGIRKVKEWLNQNCLSCGSTTPCNKEKYLGFSQRALQAFLKGVEK